MRMKADGGVCYFICCRIALNEEGSQTLRPVFFPFFLQLMAVLASGPSGESAAKLADKV